MAGDSLEGVYPSINELNSRSRHQVFHRARDDDFARSRLSEHPRSDVYGDTIDVVVRELDLACVQPHPDLDPEGTNGMGDGLGAVDRPSGPVKGDEKAVPGEPDLPSSVSREFPSCDVVVCADKVAPGAISKFGGALGGCHDIGEKYGGEDAVDFRNRSHASQELLDLGKHGLGFTDVEEVIIPGQLHESRTPDVLREITAVFDPDETVAGSVQDKRGHPDSRQNVSEIAFPPSSDNGSCCSRAHGESLEAGVPAPEALILSNARCDEVEITAGSPQLLDPLEAQRQPIPWQTPVVIDVSKAPCGAAERINAEVCSG